MSSQQYQWTFEDTFEGWLEKYNSFVELTGTEINFRFLNLSNATLVANFGAGQVRNGSTVEQLSAVQITLPSSSQIVVGIYKERNSDDSFQPAIIKSYLANAVPESFFIPIYAFTTNSTSITAVKDLRTPFTFGSGGGDTDPDVLMFKQHISRDLTIEPLKNGLSVSPIVDEGVTVTVSDGSEWSVV